MPQDHPSSDEPDVPQPGWIHRELSTEIFDVCLAGDSGRLFEILMESPESIHQLSPSTGDAPLHYAHDPWIAEILIRRGAEIDHRNRDGQSALHYACMNGNLELTAFLARSGADLRTPDRFGYPPLLQAAYSRGDRGIDIARLLMGYRVPLDLNSALSLGMTDLVREILANDPDAIASAPKPGELLRNALGQASFDADDLGFGLDLFGAEPEALARVMAGHLDLVNILIERGAPLVGALSALRTALELPDPTLAERLLSAGVPLIDPDQPERSSRYLLDAADQSRCRDEMIALLARYGIAERKE